MPNGAVVSLPAGIQPAYSCRIATGGSRVADRCIKQRVARLVCAIYLLGTPWMSVQSRPARNPVVLDANGNVRSFYGVPVTLRRSGLKRLHMPVKVRTEPGGEGGPYKVY